MTDHALAHEFNELAEEVSLTDVDGELCHIEEEEEEEHGHEDEEHGHEDEMHAGGCSCTQTVNVVVETILSDRVIVVNYILHNVHYTQTVTQLLTLKSYYVYFVASGLPTNILYSFVPPHKHNQE